MSEYDDITSQTQQHNHGKQRLKRCVLRRLRKTGSDCADVMSCGRLFQTWAAATGKARSPSISNKAGCSVLDSLSEMLKSSELQ